MARRTRARGINGSGLLIIIIIISGIIFIGKKTIDYLRLQYEMMTHPIQYSEFVEGYALENNVDKYLIYAIIKTESGFNPKSESNVGARGLMQIMEETFQWLETKQKDDLTFSDMYHPEYNIKYGTYFVGYLIRYFEDLECAVSAYHAGVGSVDAWLDNPKYSDDGKTLKTIPTSDTAHYVDKINKAYETYKKLYSV